MTPPEPRPSDLIHGDPSTELSSNRTSLSFERTRMSTDRTLMSTVRTSLSLIGFGFTIYQVFGKASPLLPNASNMGRHLGLAMLGLGVVLLAAGIASHAQFDRELRRRRQRLYDAGLMHNAPQYHVTPTYLAAILLLFIGLWAIGSIAFRLVG